MRGDRQLYDPTDIETPDAMDLFWGTNDVEVTLGFGDGKESEG